MDKDRQRLSEHLTLHEVICHCGKCSGGGVNQPVIDLFERIRAQCCICKGKDVPINVFSGYRCPTHNKKVGGAPDSEHMKGNALDLGCPQGMKMDEFHAICLALNPRGGVGFYRHDGFIHVDTRGKKARWEE